MKNFGTLKSKIESKLIELYENKNMTEFKTLVKLIKENEDFSKMYLFYEDVEKIQLDEPTAVVYLDHVISTMPTVMKKISRLVNEIDKKLGKITVNENIVYESLDMLSSEDSLNNVHKKILAKKALIEHLVKIKEIEEEKPTSLIENEKLLNTILVNNFNVLYDKTLSEEQKKELNTILSLTEDNLKENFTILKEEISSKVSEMLTESLDPELKRKLDNTKDQVTQMKPTKYNLYKLQQLKEGL